MITEKKGDTVIYGVFTNSDLTEGRGTEYPLHHCRLRATAVRLAKGQGVMGSDAKVKPIRVVNIDGVDFVQLWDIHVKGGTKEDQELEDNLPGAAEAVAQLGVSTKSTNKENT